MPLRFTIRDLLWLTVVVLFFLAGVLSGPTSLVFGEEPSDSDKEAIKKDLDGIEGTWEVVDYQRNGGDSTDTSTKHGNKFTFHRAAGTHEMIWSEAEDQVSVVKVNPSKLPKELDIITTFPGKKRAEIVFSGIYELEDDLLKICMNERQGDRPKRFTTYDERFYLVLLKRVKSSTKD